jgi:glyoxylase-like metal-dependent hydrolase (beta-lactamase superfamily II)
MRLAERIHLVGSGTMGFDLTDPYDCHIFLLDGGDELALIDTGAGMGVDAVVENIRGDGFDPARIRQIVLTHAHVDHAGGVAKARSLLPDASVLCSHAVAGFVREADEQGVSLDVAKQAGFYPLDYVLEPCEVDRELRDGDAIQLGDLTLQVLDTPGHADGHVSLLLDHAGRRTLFGGDVVFFGGTILLQNTWDCRLPEHIASLRRLRDLSITALLPSHLTLSLQNGQRHIERANESLDRLLVPNQMISAW